MNYFSISNPYVKCDYLNEILDGGDYPMFRVTPEDDSNEIIEGKSSSACWAYIC
jgi:hypothetical protein